MSFPDEPNLKIEWRGHPDTFPRTVRVFFDSEVVPDDLAVAGRDLAERLNEAKSEGQFNWQVNEYAERNDLRVTGVHHETSHRFPLGTVVTVGFERQPPMDTSVAGMEPPSKT